jgi:hypothetical protein
MFTSILKKQNVVEGRIFLSSINTKTNKLHVYNYNVMDMHRL